MGCVVTGAQGRQGDPGMKGEAGERGRVGNTGAQGTKGQKGEAGGAGAQGQRGMKGEVGMCIRIFDVYYLDNNFVTTANLLYMYICEQFWEKSLIHTTLHLMSVRKSYTNALPRNIKHLAIDGKVCFHSRLFANAIEP